MKYDAPLDEPLGVDVTAIQIAEHFGWSLDAVRDMPIGDMMTVLAYLDAVTRIRKAKK